MSDGSVKTYGFKELIGKLEHPKWAAGPAKAFMDRWRFSVEAKTKANMRPGTGGWVWKGRDRQSVTSERTDGLVFPKEARVGSNSKTIRFGEFGTGLLSDDPKSSHRRYFPPPSALEPWARDHGMTGGQVAFAIWKRGGTEPRRFLRDAAEEAKAAIPAWVGMFKRDVEAQAALHVSE